MSPTEQVNAGLVARGVPQLVAMLLTANYVDAINLSVSTGRRTVDEIVDRIMAERERKRNAAQTR